MKTGPFLLPNLLLLALLPAASGRAQALKPRLRPVAAPPLRKEKFQLYLLIGQSNMAGRGTVAAPDTLPNRPVLRLSPAGQWAVGSGQIPHSF